eukprot:5458147-Prymnesium_polylepis.1
MIQLAKARGPAPGRDAKVVLALEPNPSCCREGARTCADFSSGCGYCMQCSGNYSEPMPDG